MRLFNIKRTSEAEERNRAREAFQREERWKKDRSWTLSEEDWEWLKEIDSWLHSPVAETERRKLYRKYGITCRDGRRLRQNSETRTIEEAYAMPW